MTIQLKNKTLMRPTPDQRLEENDDGSISLWQAYSNELGRYWNKVMSFKKEEVLNVFD